MNEIYRVVGMSKQNFHQKLDRMLLHQMEQEQLLLIIRQVRQDHPRMSCRDMYRLIQPQFMGRDRFEAFCMDEGFRVQVRKNFRRTTNSLGVIRFENLIQGTEVTAVNQVWVSDITYYEMRGKFYYLTFIMDLFSRRIVGYSVADNLLTQNTTIPAIEMALKTRNGEKLSGLIFHSDGGGQYYCKEFTKITQGHHILNSMGKSVYENPNAERLNRTIKNNYLIPYDPQDMASLRKKLRKAVEMYNTQKPHGSLEGLSPDNFEKLIELLTEDQLINKRKKEAKKEKVNNNNFVYQIN
jgi:transposase InsO family protein